jgi:homoserine O-acetyltransferase
VRAQHLLVTERFKIEQLALVLGGSMGAQQTYEWAIRYPNRVKRAAPIAGTAKGSAHNRLLVECFIEAITSDPAWDGGWYEDARKVHRGLRRHARLFGLSGFTESFYNKGVWKAVGFSSVDDFVAAFLESHFLSHDPNNLILLASKWKDNDVSRITQGDLAAALGRIEAKTFVIAIEEDRFFPKDDIVAEQKLIPGSELRCVSSLWGHLALFGLDSVYSDQVDSHLKELLETK